MNYFSCRRSEEFAPKLICLRLKPGRKLPQEESEIQKKQSPVAVICLRVDRA